MAFHDDIKGTYKEIQENWKDKSLGYKCVVILSIFFTTSSLTGLAGLIIQWRGFIKEGIVFYHRNLVIPIRDLFNISLSEMEIDIIVLAMMFMLPSLSQIDYLSQKQKKKHLVIFIIIGFVTGSIFWEADNVTVMLYAVFVFGILAIGSYISNGPMKVIYLRPFLALFIVLLLAAINKGLQAPI